MDSEEYAKRHNEIRKANGRMTKSNLTRARHSAVDLINEIDAIRNTPDYDAYPEDIEQYAFTSNIRRQIVKTEESLKELKEQ